MSTLRDLLRDGKARREKRYADVRAAKADRSLPQEVRWRNYGLTTDKSVAVFLAGWIALAGIGAVVLALII